MQAHPQPAPDRGLSRSQRLTRSLDFQEAFDQKESYVGRYMVLWVRRSETAALRLGVISSRKVGGATDRNLARRRLREAWRMNRYRMAGAADVILVARRSVVQASARAVEQELLALCERAKLRATPTETTTETE